VSANALEQKARLRRELSRFDTVLFLMSAMVVVDTLGAIAIGGEQAFTWLAVLFVTFFIPSALASAELGAAIPEEGGAYVWVRMAFGQLTGALTSLLYWAGTPVWLGGSVTVVAIAVWERFFVDLSTGGMLGFGTVFVLGATVAAVAPLRYGKWVPSSGAIGQIVLLVVFTVSVGVYGVEHGVHGLALGDFTPDATIFIAVAPVLLYSFVGIELPAAAGEEMINPRRDIPVAILRAGIAQALMYGVPILAILFVLPQSQISSLHGLIDAMSSVFTVYGAAADALGVVMAALFIWVLLASGSAWIMGAGRAQAAACLDGGGPPVLGRISERTGVPVVMAVVSGVAALATMLVAIAVTRGDGQRYFSAALTVSIALIVLAYVFIFPAFVRLRYSHPGLDRPFRVPGGMAGAWAVTLLSTGWSVLAAINLLWPGIGTADPDAKLPAGFEGDRVAFELIVLSPVAILLVVCVVFFALGARTRRVNNGARHRYSPIS
jgi:amino acid transporter